MIEDKDGKVVKDLNRFGRPIGSIVVIEQSPESSLQPENILLTRPWNGDKRDNFLQELLVFLECKSIII